MPAAKQAAHRWGHAVRATHTKRAIETEVAATPRVGCKLERMLAPQVHLPRELLVAGVLELVPPE